MVSVGSRQEDVVLCGHRANLIEAWEQCMSTCIPFAYTVYYCQ